MSKQPDDSLDQIAARLVKTANQILDPQMRKHFVSARLRPLDDDLVAAAIHRIQVQALRGDGPSSALVTGGLDPVVILGDLGRVRVGRIYHEASRRGFQTVCNLFRSLKPARSPEGDEDAFLKYGLPDLTVGERRSAARSHDPIIINRVSYDTDPLVIRQLLLNNRVIEALVVNIAARRPNRPEILQEIYRAIKWRARPEVRVALVRNPYTPPQISMALVTLLKRRELEDVVFDTNLHAELRASAELALETKKSVDPPEPPAPEVATAE
jgi:hypothetical protein